MRFSSNLWEAIRSIKRNWASWLKLSFVGQKSIRATHESEHIHHESYLIGLFYCCLGFVLQALGFMNFDSVTAWNSFEKFFTWSKAQEWNCIFHMLNVHLNYSIYVSLKWFNSFRMWHVFGRICGTLGFFLKHSHEHSHLEHMAEEICYHSIVKMDVLLYTSFLDTEIRTLWYQVFSNCPFSSICSQISPMLNYIPKPIN